MTDQRTRKLLQVLGYVAFFLVCFVISLLITFPYDRLNGFTEAQLQKALGMRVSIQSVRPTLFGSIRFQGLALGPSLPTHGAPPSSSNEPYVVIDDGVLSVSYLGLLLGWVDADFDGELGDGTIEGSFEQDESHVALNLDITSLQAQRLPLLSDKVGLPVSGMLNGNITLDVPAGAAQESTGNIKLALSGGVIGDGQAKLSLSSLMGYGRGRPAEDNSDGTVIQPIKLGLIGLDSKVAEGEINIPRIEANSPDVELSLEGVIKLAEPLSNTRVDTYLTVKLTETYAKQDASTETLVSLASTVGGRAKRPDGSLGFRISGSLLRGLSFRPSKTFTSPGSTGHDRPRASKRSPNRRAGARRRPPLPNRGAPGNEDGMDNNLQHGQSTRAQPPRPSIGPRQPMVAPRSANDYNQGGRYPQQEEQEVEEEDQEQQVVEEEEVQEDQGEEEELQ